jgi:hypothetical protein
MGARAFRASDGTYLVAEEGHVYTEQTLNGKGHFHVEEHDGGKKVSLKTHNGHYVAVNGNDEIYMAHHHNTDDAKFHVEQHHGKVALKSHHGGYLGVEGGKVHVHRERTESELFEEVKV